MTQDEIKKMDKKIRMVQDPFGMGFQSFYKIISEFAQMKGKPKEEILRQYIVWKARTV
ncbi:conserved protein of unknown function [Ruminococcaceae bacterium BL-6]|jgi:hypothetical protein|nr:conserved protein of unknown function [Ruminococcaceae bacterium BL-6]